jgi:Fe-S cluster assembly protein SufD
MVQTTSTTPPKSVADFPVPSGREEAWRFTPFRRLRGLHSADAGSRPDGKLTISVEADDAVDLVPLDREDPRCAGYAPADRVAALAYRNSPDPTCIHVPAGTDASGPVVVNLAADGGTAYGHLVIEVGAEAGVDVVLNHSGSAAVAANVELRVGDGARVNLASLQEWDAGTVHVGHHSLTLGRDSAVRATHVTLGGELVRLTATARFAGPGADLRLDGLYLAGTEQHLEHRLFVDHAVPRCRSRVTYKGALSGAHARTVWVGDVLIRPEAVGTDTYELNRNLLLSAGARADSVPNLEILTGEVERAGHASATGRFDDEQLFYLGSRGIPAEEARRLVVRAFFADVIAGVPVAGLADRVRSSVEAELERALGR